MIDGEKFYNKPIKDDQRTYDKIRKIMAGQGDDYTNYLLDYPHFKKHKVIAINLSK